MKKRSKKFNFSKRLSFTLIVIFAFVLIAVGVFALSPGVKPNPGHLLTEVAPPSGCSANQYLKWTGSTWACETPSTILPSDVARGASVKTSSTTSSNVHTIVCPSGTAPLGGGCTCSGRSILDSHPFLNGWYCECTKGSTYITVAYAICAKPNYWLK